MATSVMIAALYLGTLHVNKILFVINKSDNRWLILHQSIIFIISKCIPLVLGKYSSILHFLLLTESGKTEDDQAWILNPSFTGEEVSLLL